MKSHYALPWRSIMHWFQVPLCFLVNHIFHDFPWHFHGISLVDGGLNGCDTWAKHTTTEGSLLVLGCFFRFLVLNERLLSCTLISEATLLCPFNDGAPAHDEKTLVFSLCIRLAQTFWLLLWVYVCPKFEWQFRALAPSLMFQYWLQATLVTFKFEIVS